MREGRQVTGPGKRRLVDLDDVGPGDLQPGVPPHHHLLDLMVKHNLVNQELLPDQQEDVLGEESSIDESSSGAGELPHLPSLPEVDHLDLVFTRRGQSGEEDGKVASDGDYFL